MLASPAKKAHTQLQERGIYRKKGGKDGIFGMMPAGTGELKQIKEREEFSVGNDGDELWYSHVQEGSADFAEAHRAKTTAAEQGSTPCT